MANFIDALNAGLEAANRLAADKDEIASVVADASQQIRSATNDLINLELRKFPRKSSTLRDMMAELATIDFQHYEALSFVGAPEGPEGKQRTVELAKWVSSKGGYPIKLTPDLAELSCHDKQSLERAIAAILASPTTGQKLRVLMSQLGVRSLQTPAKPKRK